MPMMDAIFAALPARQPQIHLPAKSPAAQASNAFAAKLEAGMQKAANARPLDAKAWEAAQDFEAQFLSSMLQPMFEGIKADGAFGGGQGEQMFRSLLVDQYAQQMTRAGGVGVAQSVYREILKLQESHS